MKIIRAKSMRYSFREQEVFKTQLEKLVKLKIIRNSESPYSSPIIIARNHAKIIRGKDIYTYVI